MIGIGLESYISINELWYTLLDLQTERFSGSVNLNSSQESNWTMYFYMGRLLYVTGGKHPIRRWTRQVRQSLAESFVKEAIVAVQQKEFKICWEYEVLSKWYAEGKVKREQIIEIINGIIKEVFLDLYRVRISRPEIKKAIIDFSQQWISNSVENYIIESKDEWKLWQEKGIADIDPGQRPVIRRIEELASKVSQQDHQKMLQLFKSEATLRELALKIKKPVMDVTLSLLPYIRSGIMEMVEVEDWTPSIKKSKSTINICSEVKTSPAIAYIDSNSERIENVNQQVNQLGCSFIGIQDHLNAVAILLEQRPDLILIPLHIAIINRYQLCQTLKKMSVFKDIPIVVISQDYKLLNKIQAKLAGAVALICQREELIKVFSKYISMPPGPEPLLE